MTTNLFTTANVGTRVRLTGKHTEQLAQRQDDGTWRVTGCFYRRGRWVRMTAVILNAETINLYIDTNALAFRIE